MTHVQIKSGNSFSLSFQNMVLGSLCTTWLCSDYLLLQFLSTSADALSSRPSPPAFWPHLPVTAQNSTALQDTGHHHIKHCQVTRHLCPWSSQTEHMKSERIMRTFLKFKKDHVECKSIVSHSLSGRPAFSVCPQCPATPHSAVQISQVWIWALIYLS